MDKWKYIKCRWCKHRDVKCLGSDPKNCVVPTVRIVYYTATFGLPIALIVACFCFWNFEFVWLGVIIFGHGLYHHWRMHG